MSPLEYIWALGLIEYLDVAELPSVSSSFLTGAPGCRITYTEADDDGRRRSRPVRRKRSMPFVSKIRRQTDYNIFPSSIPIVIDNGASYFRIGYLYPINPKFLLIASSVLLQILVCMDTLLKFSRVSVGQEKPSLVLFSAISCKDLATKLQVLIYVHSSKSSVFWCLYDAS